MAYKFTCPECGENVGLETKPNRETMLCPSCAKDVPVPGSKREVLLVVVLSGVIVLLLVVFIFLLLADQANKVEEQKQKEERIAEAEAEAEAEEKEIERQLEIEKDKKRWQKLTIMADRSKLKTEGDYDRALEAIEKYNGVYSDKKIELKKQIDQYKTEDIKKIITKLDREAQAFENNKELIKAIGVYQNYDRDFKEEIKQAIKKREEVYYKKAEEAAKAEKIAKAKKKAAETKKLARAKKKVEEEKKQILKDLATGLIAGKISENVAKFNASAYKKDYPEIAKMVDNITKVNQIVLSSFKDQVGRKIQLSLKEGKSTLLIKRVEKGKINAEFKKGKLSFIKKYSVKDLADAEVMKRLSAYDKSAAYLTAGIEAVKKGRYDPAKQYFQNTGNLAIPLIAALEELKVQKESRGESSVKKEKKVNKPLKPLNPKKIKLTAKVSRSGKKHFGLGEVEFGVTARLSVKNSTGYDLKGYKITFFLIGALVAEKKMYTIIKDFEQNLNLEIKEEFKKRCEFITKYNIGARVDHDDNDSYTIYPPKGHKYYSWLMIVENSDGTIKITKSKHSKFEKIADKIVKSKKNDFTKDGRIIEEDYRPYDY